MADFEEKGWTLRQVLKNSTLQLSNSLVYWRYQGNDVYIDVLDHGNPMRGFQMVNFGHREIKFCQSILITLPAVH